MRIDSRQISPDSSDEALKARQRMQLAQSAPAKVVNESAQAERPAARPAVDSVSLGNTAVKAEFANYTMSEIKHKADEVIRRIEDGESKPTGGSTDEVQSMAEERGELDRQERIEIARLRVSSGFYDRPEVIDELARRISENM